METLGKEQKEQKEQEEYFCEKCNFKCIKKFNWNRHLMTSKHKEEIFGKEQKEKKEKKEQIHICTCGKTYTNPSGLWKHKKVCKFDEIYTISNINNLLNSADIGNLIQYLMKENSEFKQLLINQSSQMVEITKNVGNNNYNNNNDKNMNNSNNKHFNLQFFLNETCKDAMNITDFVDSIKLQLSDLMEVGELGYVEGISNIIVKNLNALDETARPLHCTDKKRETIYIKDEGQWEKEDDNKTKIKKAINKVAHKNIKLISQFREKYPECIKCESQLSDKYNKMIIEAMGGAGDNTSEKTEKIIRNITRATTIKKL